MTDIHSLRSIKPALVHKRTGSSEPFRCYPSM